MSPTVKALIQIVEEAEASYVGQALERVIEDAREHGIDVGSGTPTTESLDALLRKGVHVDQAVRVYALALDALREEEDAARKRIAGRLFKVDGATLYGREVLEGMADGATFEDVFALDALSVAETLTQGGGAVPVTHTQRIV